MNFYAIGDARERDLRKSLGGMFRLRLGNYLSRIFHVYEINLITIDS